MEVEVEGVADDNAANAGEAGAQADAGEASEAGQSSEAAGGAWVRIAPAAELLLLRALRYAERASHAAAMKPAPQTRMMRAALVAKPLHTPSPNPYPSLDPYPNASPSPDPNPSFNPNQVAKPPRTASAVPYAPTPLFATRRHFEVTEVHI